MKIEYDLAELLDNGTPHSDVIDMVVDKIQRKNALITAKNKRIKELEKEVLKYRRTVNLINRRNK